METKTYKATKTETFLVPQGVEYKAPHMTEWALAQPGNLTVHAGDELRAAANHPEAAELLEKVFAES